MSVEIPRDGYIKICTDPENSLIVALVNSVDGLMSMASLAGDIKDFDVNSKAFSEKLTKKLLADEIYMELMKDGGKATKDLWKNVGKETFITNESMGSYTETVINNIYDLELEDIIVDTAAEFGWEVGEDVFLKLAGPAGVALELIFVMGKVENIIIQHNDLIQSAGVGSIYIQNQGGGRRSCQQIKIESQKGLTADTSLSVFTVELDETLLDILKTLDPDIYKALTNGTSYTYNISILRNGKEIQPSGKVTVYIPIPEDIKTRVYTSEIIGGIAGKIRIYRIEADGTMTEMDVDIEDGCFVFTTDHFSLYTIVDHGATGALTKSTTMIVAVGVCIAVIGICAIVVTLGILVLTAVLRRKKNKS